MKQLDPPGGLDINWDNLLEPAIPAHLLYQAQIVERMLMPGADAKAMDKVKAKEYMSHFDVVGGVAHVFKLIQTADVAVSVARPLSRAALATMLKLACFFVEVRHPVCGLPAGLNVSTMPIVYFHAQQHIKELTVQDSVDFTALTQAAVRTFAALARAAGTRQRASDTVYTEEPVTLEEAEEMGRRGCGRPWRSVEAEGLRWCVRLFSTLCRERPALLKHLYTTLPAGAAADTRPAYTTGVVSALLLGRHRQVREGVCQRIEEFAKLLPSGDASIPAGMLSPEEHTMPLLLQHVEDVYQLNADSYFYFRLLKTLVRQHSARARVATH